MFQRGGLIVAVGVALLGGPALLFTMHPAAQQTWQGPHLVTTPDGQVEVHVIVPHVSAPPGMMHYVEHLAWLNAVGGKARAADRHSNAWTNPWAVGYWLTGKPEDLAELLATLARVFQPIDLDVTFAEEERGIILREYDLRLGNNPAGRLAERMTQALYAETEFGNSIIGTPEEIAGFRLDDAIRIHSRSHHRDRAAVFVSGPITQKELEDALSAAGFPAVSEMPDEIEVPAVSPGTSFETEFQEPGFAGSPHLVWRKVVTLPAPVDFDLLDVQTRLVTMYLDSTLPGGMAGPLRHDRRITRRFGVEVFPIDERHIELSFRAEPDRGVSLVQLKEAVTSVFTSSARGMPVETYDRLLTRLETFWPDWKDPRARANWIVHYSTTRLGQLKVPKSEEQLRKVQHEIRRVDLELLLNALAGHGRTVYGLLGKETM